MIHAGVAWEMGFHWNLEKNKNKPFNFSKVIVKKIKRQSKVYKKIFVKDIFNVEFVSRIYKKFQNSTIRKQSTQWNWAKLNRHFTKDTWMIYMHWKETQHC